MPAERRNSYIRVAREVEPTPHVENFLRRLDDYALEFLPDWSRTGRRLARTIDELKHEGIDPQIKEVKSSAISRRDVNNLRATLYEYRQPATKDGKFRLMHRLTGLAQLDLMDLTPETNSEPLRVTSSYIIESTSRTHFSSRTRWEFSLVIDDGPELRQVQQEARELQRISGVPVGHRGLYAVREPEQAAVDEAGIVPLFTVERWAGKLALNEFVERINLDGVGAPLVNMNLLLPELDVKSR